MNLYKEGTWQHVITGVDGDTILFDVNVFDYEWIPTNRKAVVNDLSSTLCFSHLYHRDTAYKI